MTDKQNPFDNENFEEYADEIKSSINKAMSVLLEHGFAEVAGVNENGEFLYQATQLTRDMGVDAVMDTLQEKGLA